MPPAAPRMATFLSGVDELLYARWDAASACWDRRRSPLILLFDTTKGLGDRPTKFDGTFWHLQRHAPNLLGFERASSGMVAASAGSLLGVFC